MFSTKLIVDSVFSLFQCVKDTHREKALSINPIQDRLFRGCSRMDSTLKQRGNESTWFVCRVEIAF